MAETITVPSPSIFLNSADPSPLTAQAPAKQSAPRSQKAATKGAAKAKDSNGITKRKQSKSRNGCITCKAKRLKCDETKPACQQCAKRSVPCGGYKKDFKWRPFEETSFAGKPPGKAKKDVSSSTSTPTHSYVDNLPFQNVPNNDVIHDAYFFPPRSPATMYALPSTSAFVQQPYPAMSDVYTMPQPSPYLMAPPISPMDQFMSGSVGSSNSTFEADSIDTRRTKTATASSVSSGQSPRLIDLLLPGTDLSVPPEEYELYRSQYPESFYQPTDFTPPAEPMEDDDVEEIPRNFNADHEAWVMRLPSPTPSNSSSSSSDSSKFPLLRQPQFSMSSPEMLTRRFDRDTCGVLSVKDGPTENPWRTFVWPLARDCPALYHAIASMTSFHSSRDLPPMRLHGIDHMRTSVHALASSLENMRVDAAISTTLALAFCESWDQHISTGINHIKGAKLLIDKALTQQEHSPAQGEEFNRLKFLCNTWIYMDVLSRLTSTDDDESNDFDIVSDAIYMNGQKDAQLDPLMGCASTLFPIIGRVANLVRKVRRTESNSPSMISQAAELKKQLEEWVPPDFIEDPEDETTSPHDSIRTAHAYQYATLLYLHQAVPQIPSLPSIVLAKKAMCELATVLPTSRSVIVHIYPLMAAGCEAVEQEDREWVQSRWEMLSQRMKLGIIDRSLEVTKEVWSRRDAYAAEELTSSHLPSDNIPSARPSLKRDFSSLSDDMEADGLFCWLDVGSKRRAVDSAGLFDSPQSMPIRSERSEGKRRSGAGIEALPYDYTIRGRLNWLGVMKDWKWEVLLG